MRRGGRAADLPHFFFFISGRPERRTLAGTRRAGQSDCAPSEELAERRRAEATQRERERKRKPSNLGQLSPVLKLGLASPPGKCFRAQLVWVELAGIKPARSWRAASAPPPLRHLWAVAAVAGGWGCEGGQGPQVLVILRWPGAHSRSELLQDQGSLSGVSM